LLGDLFSGRFYGLNRPTTSATCTTNQCGRWP